MKKSIFENIYAEETAIRLAYECGSEQDGSRAEARREMKALQERITEKGQDFTKVYRLYKDAKDRGNEYIDICDAVFEQDAASLIENLKRHNIEKFTFSSNWSGAVETAWLFTQNGCQLEGMTEINSQHADCLTGEREKVHGYLFRIAG